MVTNAARLAPTNTAATGRRGRPARSASGRLKSHQANHAVASSPSKAVAFRERRNERSAGASVTTSQAARERTTASAA